MSAVQWVNESENTHGRPHGIQIPPVRSTRQRISIRSHPRQLGESVLVGDIWGRYRNLVPLQAMALLLYNRCRPSIVDGGVVPWPEDVDGPRLEDTIRCRYRVQRKK